MRDKKLYIFPVIFVLVMVPVFIVALLTYRPGQSASGKDCPSVPAVISHSHGAALASTIKGDMQLLMNVSAAAPLYEVVDGSLQICGETSGEMKHITVDVNDARLNLGERLPVTVSLTIRRADNGLTVIEATAPAMYSPGHGYHFGDNFLLPAGTEYEWTVIISPVKALRQAGAQQFWLDPVEWEGRFELDADGNVMGQAAKVTPIGDFTESGLHVMLGTHDAAPLYAVDSTTTPQEIEPGSRYFVVDVTDHAVNYEEKLPGADVVLTFRQGETVLDVPLEAVISPVYGFHYGANVALGPGTWQITVTVAGLDFLRHAGAAVDLAQKPISSTFEYQFQD
jgi:hypothetical protein